MRYMFNITMDKRQFLILSRAPLNQSHCFHRPHVSVSVSVSVWALELLDNSEHIYECYGAIPATVDREGILVPI